MFHPAAEEMRVRIRYLRLPEIEQLVEQMLDQPADQVALRLHGKCEHPAWVATQVATLQKARTKLPTWYANRCILMPTPLEQCTSEAAAKLKPDLRVGHLLDLTCGLGVDTWHFARQFAQVTTLEQDPALAELAQHNIERLGLNNVTVVNARAEDYLSAHAHQRWDVVYADPARREGGGQRRFLLQDCSPDVLALRPHLNVTASETWIKMSPLFDLTEAERLLSPLKEMRVIAVDGEVKEVMLGWSAEQRGAPHRVAAWLHKGQHHLFSATPSDQTFSQKVPEDARFVLAPDVSLYKAGLENQYMSQMVPTAGSEVQGGYFFAGEMPQSFAGTSYQLVERMPYQPGKVSSRLRALGIERVNLTRRAFDVPLQQVRESLRMHEGGDDFLLLTRDAAGKRWALLARRVFSI